MVAIIARGLLRLARAGKVGLQLLAIQTLDRQQASQRVVHTDLQGSLELGGQVAAP